MRDMFGNELKVGDLVVHPVSTGQHQRTNAVSEVVKVRDVTCAVRQVWPPLPLRYRFGIRDTVDLRREETIFKVGTYPYIMPENDLRDLPAYEEGKAEYRNKGYGYRNPYLPASPEGAAWRMGWYEAREA